MNRTARPTPFLLAQVTLLAVGCSASSNGGSGTLETGGASGIGGNAGSAAAAGSGNGTAGADGTAGANGTAGGGNGAGGTNGTAGAGNGAGGVGTAGTNGAGGADTSPAEWPMMGGNLASTYNNTKETLISATTASTLTQGWTLATSGSPTGTPAIVDGNVYITSANKTYMADAKTGVVKWSIGLGASSSPAYSGGLLYVQDSGSKLHALDATNGMEKWSKVTNTFASASGFSSPVVSGALVIVGTTSGQEEGFSTPTFRGAVVAYDRLTGDEKWRFYTVDASHNGATVWSTVTVDPDAGMVFIATGNNYSGGATDTSDAIIAVSLSAGTLMWKHQVTAADVWSNFVNPNPADSMDHDFGANPTLFEATIGGKLTKLVGAGTKGGIFVALDRMTGASIWTQQVGPGTTLRGGMLNNGAFDGKHILVASNNGTSTAPGSEGLLVTGSVVSRLAALDPATGAVVWDRQIGGAVWGPITTANGVGFVSAENRFEAFNTDTGARLFQLTVAGTVVSAAAIINGFVYFGSGMEYFTGINASTFYALKLK